jgi:hypothetical protein
MRRPLFITTLIILGIAFALQPTCECAAQSKKEAATETKAKTSYEVLKGRWQRPDGGYILQIRTIDAGGKIDAGYFNPRPINVSRAEATQEGGKMKVFVELRDTGYPGSVYALTYDPKDDVLRGVYFQAALKQNFDVYFTRMK